MKTKLSLLFAAAAFALLPAIHAADKSPSDKKEPTTQAPARNQGSCPCAREKKEPERKTVLLTGSHLPQKVTKVGRVTDSMAPVTVLTREDIDLTGASDVGSALRKLMPQMR